MLKQLIIAGFGGQGILLMGQLLAYAGMLTDKEVSWMPAYGAEMRGGSANCAVIISDDPIGSPKVEDADFVVAMNRLSMDLFEKNLVPGGVLMLNSSIINTEPKRKDIKVVKIPCNEIADRLGNARVANMVMLGALLAVDPIFTEEILIESLREKWGPTREKLIPVNQQAVEEGMKVVKG